MAGLRIPAVMAVHNRRDHTLACLDSLRAQQLLGGTLDVFVLDDASTDDTAAAIVERQPDVRLLRGDGQLYWNGGMRRAFGQAMAGDYDYYLWMNDDTKLDDGVLALLQRAHFRRSVSGVGRQLGGTPVRDDEGGTAGV
jgi:GT2 family glycosyltransferase